MRIPPLKKGGQGGFFPNLSLLGSDTKDMELNDRQWAMIEPLIPVWKPAINGSGRPPPYQVRTILEKILWVCRSGARWKDLPRVEGEPSYQTCHRWFQYWNGEGIWLHILSVLGNELGYRGIIEPKRQIIDGSFGAGKKGA